MPVPDASRQRHLEAGFRHVDAAYKEVLLALDQLRRANAQLGVTEDHARLLGSVALEQAAFRTAEGLEALADTLFAVTDQESRRLG